MKVPNTEIGQRSIRYLQHIPYGLLAILAGDTFQLASLTTAKSVSVLPIPPHDLVSTHPTSSVLWLYPPRGLLVHGQKRDKNTASRPKKQETTETLYWDTLLGPFSLMSPNPRPRPSARLS